MRAQCADCHVQSEMGVCKAVTPLVLIRGELYLIIREIREWPRIGGREGGGEKSGKLENRSNWLNQTL